jgi:ribonucleoside-triphosphate reductase (formate)
MKYINYINEYTQRITWKVSENANSGYSIGGLNNFISSSETENYYLNSVFSEKAKQAHLTGEIHIHDLALLAPYCAGWSLRQLIAEGLHGGEGKTRSLPAKHYFTLIQQMINFLGIMQNEFSGAQAFSSVDTYLAPFVRYDKLTFAQVKQGIQFLVFGLNVPSRWSSQCPFSNLTFDWECPEDLKNQAAIIGGNPYENFTYADFQEEMDLINKAFIEVMMEGDADGRGFAFPIPTYNITKGFSWHTENASLLCEMTGKYGIPYFQNFVSSDLDPTAVRSMCCRLQLDKRELQTRSGGLFGAGEQTGSIGVVTVNLPLLMHKAKKDNRENEFLVMLEDTLYTCKDILETKRKVIAELFGKNFFPYAKQYLKDFDSHFSTIGLIGANEMCLTKFNKDLTNPESIAYTRGVLDFMKSSIKKFQKETGNLYNLEATPAEATSYRLAKISKELFPEIITAGTPDTPYFTNSTQLPVGCTEDIFTALDLQEPLQTAYTGGTVFHAMLTSSISDPDTVRDLLTTIFTNYKLPYLSLTPTYSICAKHGYLQGEQFICPKCGAETEVYSRIVGYYRPIKNWNKGKQQEYKERITFSNFAEEN